LFYGKEVAIGKIFKKEICYACGKEFETPLKWSIVKHSFVKNNDKYKYKVLEEHPLNCDIEAAFGKYGFPMDFWD